MDAVVTVVDGDAQAEGRPSGAQGSPRAYEHFPASDTAIHLAFCAAGEKHQQT